MKNELLTEALTVHFHGQHQRGTPWMDGTGGVSQRALEPGEKFVYRSERSAMKGIFLETSSQNELIQISPLISPFSMLG